MQTSVETNQAIGKAGQIVNNLTTRSYANNTAKLDAVTMTAVDLATTCTINGTAFTVNSGAASKTKTELRDLLIIEINSGSEPVTASIKDADEFYVVSDDSAVTTTVVGTTNCSVAVVIDFQTTVPWGVGVVLDPTNALTGTGGAKRARLPQAATDITNVYSFLGITVRDLAAQNAGVAGTNVGYVHRSAMGVLQTGTIYVEVEDAVVAGAEVYCRYEATASNPQLGAFRSDGDTSKAAIVAACRYATDAAAGGIAEIQVVNPSTVS